MSLSAFGPESVLPLVVALMWCLLSCCWEHGPGGRSGYFCRLRSAWPRSWSSAFWRRMIWRCLGLCWSWCRSNGATAQPILCPHSRYLSGWRWRHSCCRSSWCPAFIGASELYLNRDTSHQLKHQVFAALRAVALCHRRRSMNGFWESRRWAWMDINQAPGFCDFQVPYRWGALTSRFDFQPAYHRRRWWCLASGIWQSGYQRSTSYRDAAIYLDIVLQNHNAQRDFLSDLWATQFANQLHQLHFRSFFEQAGLHSQFFQVFDTFACFQIFWWTYSYSDWWNHSSPKDPVPSGIG